MEDVIQWADAIRALPSKPGDGQDDAAFGVERYDAAVPHLELLRDLFAEARAAKNLFPDHINEYKAGQAILNSAGPVQLRVLMMAFAIYDSHERFLEAQNFTSSNMRAMQETFDLGLLIKDMLKRKVEWCEQSLVFVWGVAGVEEASIAMRLITSTLRWAKSQKHFPVALRDVIKTYQKTHAQIDFFRYGTPSEDQKLAKRLEELLSLSDTAVQSQVKIALPACDAWTEAFHNTKQPHAPIWNELFKIWASRTSAKPSQAKLKKVDALFKKYGTSLFLETMQVVFASIGKPASEQSQARPRRHDYHYFAPYREPTLLHDDHAHKLRGLIWSFARLDVPAHLRLIGDVADRSYQKVRGFGTRSVKLGNACVWLLSEYGGLEGVGEVNRLLGRAKNATVRRYIERTLIHAAESQGISRDELDDLAVPLLGLTGIGTRDQAFGTYVANLSIKSSTSTELVWQTPTGKTQKTVPKAVKDEYPDAVKALKTDAKSLGKAVQGQRERLERAMLYPRVWAYRQWKERMLDHPLMGWLSRRLIWSVRDKDNAIVAAAWHDGQLVTSDDRPAKEVVKFGKQTELGLWHPIDATQDTVCAWRDWMMRHEVTQPFKQAYREVYLLTDAERQSRVYSNRYAAHIIRQHQFTALCQARGWSYQLMGNWDCDSTPTLKIPGWDLLAEFWINHPGDGEVSEHGIFMLMATDQVLFFDAPHSEPIHSDGECQPIALDQVPPRVFSEVMRDVDLFVGVASVGNDPNWQDGGPDGLYRDYWHTYSFGDLGATAQTRRDILERLVPRLKIADRCSFEEKFLVVRGDKRTYKIHLGSSNILMAPNDQYLCIVPGRGDAKVAGDVFLPFEGDQRLAVILSKAMMLAADTKITDPTILSQIRA